MAEKFTKEDLNQFDKDALIALLLSMQEQVDALGKNLELLTEQVAVARQQRFGRSSEKLQLDGQISMCFNEAESLAPEETDEPTLEEVCPAKKLRKKKAKGKRTADLKNFPVKVIPHEISDEKLHELFGEKWKRLPDEVYQRLAFHPATYEVEEHHVAVYAGTDNQTIVRAERPKDLLRNSIATPSLVAGIWNAKYVNAVPLYRIEQEFHRNGVNLSRQCMAHWSIECADRYLAVMYDRLHQEIYQCPVIQADETPVYVTKDGRPAGSKSYMWVYRTGEMYPEKAAVLYEYQKTRKADHPKEFLKDFKGVVVTDGYEVYHSLERQRQDLTIAGCWSHARRRFAEVVKAFGKEDSRSSIAKDALIQIAAIYAADKLLADLTPEERARRRQISVKPLVESFFAWVKEVRSDVLPKSKTGKGLQYCINQEQFLKTFLEHGDVPLDNNAAERAIRGFCIGKHNWHLIDTVRGAESSAIIYSITETAKANHLNPYRYLELLLTEIPKHLDDTDRSFLEDLLPWSDKLPEECKKPIKC